jgi:hypothetical protein
MGRLADLAVTDVHHDGVDQDHRVDLWSNGRFLPPGAIRDVGLSWIRWLFVLSSSSICRSCAFVLHWTREARDLTHHFDASTIM